MRSVRTVHWRLGVVSMAVVTLFLAAACSGSKSSSTTSSKKNSTLTIALSDDVADTDSINVRASDDVLALDGTVYESLFNSGSDGQITPGLAKSATPSQANKVWTLALQSGVKFQDGAPFDAAAVKANFDTILDPKQASSLAGDLANIESVAVAGPLSVTITLKKPDSGFIGLLTDITVMGDMALRAKEGAKTFDQHPVGTGPYEWVSRVVGSNVTFKAFPGYWRGTPPFTKVIEQIIPDPTVATLALKNGDVDMMVNNLSTEAISSLKKDNTVQVLSKPSNVLYGAFLNEEKERRGGYQDALAFRQGLSGLFNGAKIVPSVIGAFGTYTDQFIAPFQTGHDPSIQPPAYDPTTDVGLLTKGGYPPGSTLSIVVNTAPFLCDVATVVQSELQQLKYKVNLLCDGGNLEAAALAGYKWDALLTKGQETVSPSAFFQKRWRYDLAPPLDDYYTLEDKNLESVVEAAPQQTTEAATTAMVQKEQKIILEQDVAFIPLYFSNTIMIASKDVHGLVLSPLGYNNILWNGYTKVTKG
jgi:peptide/nickel transport system substrate-binding protein